MENLGKLTIGKGWLCDTFANLMDEPIAFSDGQHIGINTQCIIRDSKLLELLGKTSKYKGLTGEGYRELLVETDSIFESFLYWYPTENRVELSIEDIYNEGDYFTWTLDAEGSDAEEYQNVQRNLKDYAEHWHGASLVDILKDA